MYTFKKALPPPTTVRSFVAFNQLLFGVEPNCKLFLYSNRGTFWKGSWHYCNKEYIVAGLYPFNYTINLNIIMTLTLYYFFELMI